MIVFYIMLAGFWRNWFLWW